MSPISGLDPEAARQLTQALVDVSAAVTSSMDPERLHRALADTAVPALADFCTVHHVGSDAEPRLVAAVHRDPELEPFVREWGERYQTRSYGGGLLQALRDEGVVRYEELTPDVLESVALDDHHRELQRILNPTSIIVLPLRGRGGITGGLTLAFSDSGRRWHDRLVDAAEALARQAGLALDNARLYTERSEVARILQASLLPASLPDIKGVDTAVRYRAAGHATAVGGDCYDVFCTGEQAPAFVVADVVGKGAEAAALTSLVRHTLRAAYFRGEPPQLALGLVNQALIVADIPGRFCTAIHGWVVDRDNDGVTIELASAGHPPPLVLRADGDVEEIDVSGLLLGVTRDAVFGSATVTLRHGDTMLLYTDGVTELTGIDPLVGEGILREQLAASAGRSAREIVEAVERRALLEAEGAMRDDIALLALQATAT